MEDQLLAKSYKIVQQWNHWLTQFPGNIVSETEQVYLQAKLSQRYGKHALLIGLPNQRTLLQALAIAHQVIVSPLADQSLEHAYIESHFNELPINTGSVDLVIVPHTLEYSENPRKLLAEACRVVKPEGHIIIFGFNPFSLWGIKKWWANSKEAPWSGNFLSANTLKHWLKLADFELLKQDNLLFRPLFNQDFCNKFKILDRLGQALHLPIGGLYALTAKAKVIPLTPIRMHWKQTLSPIHVTIPRPTLRDF
jgi:SAM-dependent methyltransferase